MRWKNFCHSDFVTLLYSGPPPINLLPGLLSPMSNCNARRGTP
jgi:hypothetical protein